MSREPDCIRHALVYPQGLCEPKELLSFIQLDPYVKAFSKLDLTDDEQRTIEVGIMLHPTVSVVMEGTGGVREFQCSTPTNSPGSLHLSVYYAYFPEHGTVGLIYVAMTDDIGELKPEERVELKGMFEEIQELLDG